MEKGKPVSRIFQTIKIYKDFESYKKFGHYNRILQCPN